jgi:exopolysaccharide production protein ExoQ
MQTTTNKMFLASEPALGVLALLFFMGAILPVWRNPEHWFMDARASDPVALFVQILVYLSVLLLALRSWRDVLRAIRWNPLVTALLVLTIVSVAWSGVPLFTFRRAIALIATTAFGFYLGARYDTKEQIRLLGLALGISVLLSLVFIVVFPRYGIESGPNAGAWRGVFIQKNTYGRYMVMAVFTFLCLRTRRVQHMGKILLIILALGLLAGSLSAGSYMMMVFLIVLVVVYQVLYLPRRNLIPIGIVVGAILSACATYVALNAATVFEILGRNSTLTGRVPLWHFLLYEIGQHPWLGYGYVGFWSTENHTVWAQIGWTPLKAHNGYLDLWLELGFLGVALFVMNTVVVLGRSVKFVAKAHTLESQWPLLMLSLVILHNMFESDLLIQNGFMWIIYVAIAVSMERALHIERVPVPALVLSKAQASG